MQNRFNRADVRAAVHFLRALAAGEGAAAGSAHGRASSPSLASPIRPQSGAHHSASRCVRCYECHEDMPVERVVQCPACLRPMHAACLLHPACKGASTKKSKGEAVEEGVARPVLLESSSSSSAASSSAAAGGAAGG